MDDDMHKRRDPRAGAAPSGDGAARGTGYGAGGLGAGGDRAAGAPNSWDAPGVTPDGHRTGSSTDGPRTAHDGEGEPDPEGDAED